jgi:hypothetical protein
MEIDKVEFKNIKNEELEWFVEPDPMKFINIPQGQSNLIYGIDISEYKPDKPGKYDLNITVEKFNKVEHGVYSFRAKTLSVFEIPIPYESEPTPALLFEFVCMAAYYFYKHFEERKVNTREFATQLDAPRFEDLKDQIQRYIDHWVLNVRQLPLN